MSTTIAVDADKVTHVDLGPFELHLRTVAALPGPIPLSMAGDGDQLELTCYDPAVTAATLAAAVAGYLRAPMLSVEAQLIAMQENLVGQQELIDALIDVILGGM